MVSLSVKFIALFVIFFSTRTVSIGSIASVSNCGGTIETTRGFIQSPNFPKSFPIPVRCAWLLKTPANKRTVLYFTQFYLRFGFRVSEYDLYEEVDGKPYAVGRRNLGTINFEEEITSLMALKPYLLIEFELTGNEIAGNTHLRVEEYMTDVYGFNITYETVPSNEIWRGDACSVYKCSFLGNCLASKDFGDYYCECFDGFFGDRCQFGPACNPEQGINRCKNGGYCRYFSGSLYNKCDCPTGFKGIQCQIRDAGHIPKECLKFGCSQSCEKHNDDTYICKCYENFQLDADNKTCVERGLLRYILFFTITNERIRRVAAKNGTMLHMFISLLERQIRKVFQSGLGLVDYAEICNAS